MKPCAVRYPSFHATIQYLSEVTLAEVIVHGVMEVSTLTYLTLHNT